MTIERKVMFPSHTRVHLCGYQRLVLLLVREVLFSTCKLDQLLNSSSFLQYLTTVHQTNVSNFFFHSSDLESVRSKTALFQKPWKLQLDNLIETSEKSSQQCMNGQSLRLLLYMSLRRLTRGIQTANSENLSDCHCLPSLTASKICFQPNSWKFS